MNKRNRVFIIGLAFILLVGMTGCNMMKKSSIPGRPSGVADPLRDPTKKVISIGYSDFSNGNPYRMQIESLFKKNADVLKKAGTISTYYMVDAAKGTNQQISQINTLIAKQVSTIIIDPSSQTALDGVISKAQSAGIPVVVVHSGPVTNKDCHQIIDDYSGIAGEKATYIAGRLKGAGNVLIMRGISGTVTDKIMYQSMTGVFSKYPNIKIVGTVYANCSSATAQKRVAALLTKLPKVDAVIGEGGDDDIGAVRAFQGAHRAVPLVTGENDGYFLSWWAKQTKSSGYHTISSSFNPWSGAAGLYVALDILGGKTLATTITIPAFMINQSNLPKYMKTAPKAIATPSYTRKWVTNTLERQIV